MNLYANFTVLAVLVALATRQNLSAAPETAQPLLEREKWQFTDQQAWKWEGEGAATELMLKSESKYKPKFRSPFNLAWFGSAIWESFTLTAEVRLDKFDKGNNDVCIAFGKESDTRFYYAHLGEKADNIHLQLHLVDDADRKSITQQRAESIPWEEKKWHAVKLERNTATGTIRVWFDGVEVLSATDQTLKSGAIGFGSFDDLASFRNIKISPN